TPQTLLTPIRLDQITHNPPPLRLRIILIPRPPRTPQNQKRRDKKSQPLHLHNSIIEKFPQRFQPIAKRRDTRKGGAGCLSEPRAHASLPTNQNAPNVTHPSLQK